MGSIKEMHVASYQVACWLTILQHNLTVYYIRKLLTKLMNTTGFNRNEKHHKIKIPIVAKI